MKLFSKKYKAFTMATFSTIAMALGIYIAGTNKQKRTEEYKMKQIFALVLALLVLAVPALAIGSARWSGSATHPGSVCVVR